VDWFRLLTFAMESIQSGIALPGQAPAALAFRAGPGSYPHVPSSDCRCSQRATTSKPSSLRLRRRSNQLWPSSVNSMKLPSGSRTAVMRIPPTCSGS